MPLRGSIKAFSLLHIVTVVGLIVAKSVWLYNYPAVMHLDCIARHVMQTVTAISIIFIWALSTNAIMNLIPMWF